MLRQAELIFSDEMNPGKFERQVFLMERLVQPSIENAFVLAHYKLGNLSAGKCRPGQSVATQRQSGSQLNRYSVAQSHLSFQSGLPQSGQISPFSSGRPWHWRQSPITGR